MSAYDEAAEKAVKQVITQYFEHHPVLSDASVAENLAGLLNSDNEKIRLGAIKMWSILRAMKPRDQDNDAPSMEEILRTEAQEKRKESETVIYVDEHPSTQAGQQCPWPSSTMTYIPDRDGMETSRTSRLFAKRFNGFGVIPVVTSFDH